MFWNSHLRALADPVDSASPIDDRWGKLNPSFLPPASGEIKLASLMSLALQCNLGGSIWLHQFVFGFDLIGNLAQRLGYPCGPKATSKKPFLPAKPSRPAASRFADRDSKSGRKNAHPL